MARRLRWLPKRAKKATTPLCMALPKQGIARPRQCMEKFLTVKTAAKRISIALTSADKSIAAARMARRLCWLSRTKAKKTWHCPRWSEVMHFQRDFEPFCLNLVHVIVALYFLIQR